MAKNNNIAVTAVGHRGCWVDRPHGCLNNGQWTSSNPRVGNSNNSRRFSNFVVVAGRINAISSDNRPHRLATTFFKTYVSTTLCPLTWAAG